MTIHRDLVDSELHETKGAAAALAGQVLVATGVGAAVYKALLGNVVEVNVLADLPTAAAGKITLLANTVYLFGASVNIGTDFLQFSAGTSIQCLAAFTATVTYTGTVPMLQGGDSNTRIKDINLLCSNSDVYSWIDATPGTSIIIITDVLIIACKGIGTFNNVGTLIIDGSTIVSCTTGITYIGSAIGGTRLSSLNMLSTSVTFIGINFTGATLSNVNVDGVVMTGGAGSIGIKGDAGSVNIVANRIANIANVQFSGVTTPLSGITVDDIRFNFQGNGIVRDSMPDALVTLTANATVTTLAVGVPTLVAGTWTLVRASQYTTTTGGRATLDSERNVLTPIDASVVIDPASGTNKSIRVFIALNGVAINDSGMSVNISSGDPKEIAVPWQIDLSTTDFVEVFIENETDSVNCTVIDATLRLR